MGFYRLALAILVLLSHTGMTFGAFNEGVVAVVQFYLLSGFVMTALVGRYYPSLNHIGSFFVDRAARIGPQFYFYLFITVFVIYYIQPGARNWIIIDLKGFILNGFIIPLDFYMYFLNDRLYMPQTWSLGLEVLFYISFPFLLFFRLRLVATILSVPVFLTAVTGTIETDAFGYRWLPGTLFMFLLGSFIYDARSRWLPPWLVAAWLACFAVFIASVTIGRLDRPYTKEVTLGLTVGLPIVWLLRRQPWGRVDVLAGNISYGLFLCHNAVIFYATSRGIPVEKPVWAAVIVIICIGLAYASYIFIEEPFIRLRRAMRDRRSITQTAGGSTD